MDAVNKARLALLKDFRDGCKSTVREIADAWLTLEQDPTAEQVRGQIMRTLHSLKGESRVMGYLDVMALVHDAEELVLSTAKMGVDEVSDAGDALLAVCDFIAGRVLGGPEPKPADEQHTAALQVQMHAMVAAAHGSAPQPSDEPNDRGAPRSAEQEATEAPAVAQGAPSAASDAADRAGNAAAGAGPPERTVRVDLSLAGAIADSASELVLAHQRYERSIRDLRRVASDLDAIRQGAGGAEVLGGEKESETPIAKRLAEAVGALQLLVHEGRLHARDLDERARGLRLVPMRRVLDKYARAVRDLAKELGKKVDLQIDDGGLSVDADVAERISEPLLHIVRNAIDHGIESPETRVSVGKAERGRLTLGANAVGSRIRLVIADDGRGLDPEAMGKRAVERGLLSEAALQDGSWDPVGLLFERGFSTRSSLTDVSGRGVGLDVVKHAVESLGGSVRLEYVTGKGCTFTFDVPSSVALARVLVVTVGSHCFAFPSQAVAGVLRISAVRHEIVNDRPAIRFRGRPVPFVQLGELLGSGWDHCEGDTVVVVSHEGGAAALAVSSCQSHSEVAVRPFGSMLAPARVVSGCAILDSGAITHVLNPATLLPSVTGAREAASLHQAKPGTPIEMPGARILVAEDSSITRTLVTKVLQSFGYEVLEAADGAEALELLQHTTVDLILTDIDMPNVTGPELIRRVRSDPNNSRIPIVVLTSRGSDNDKKLASDAGADSYLVKADFSESALRRVIGDQLGTV